MNLNEYIAGKAPDEWDLEKQSGAEGTLSFSWRVLHGEEDTHTGQVGTEASGEGYSYELKSTDRAYRAGSGYAVEHRYVDGMGVLGEIPCFTRSNLPPAARARISAATRWGLTALVGVQDLLSACASAAARAGITLDYSGVHAGDVQVPLIDNGSTVGSVLDYIASRVPNMTTRVRGTTVTVCGGEGALTSAATYAKAVIECSPEMRTGTLTVGSTVVDLAAVYAANAGSPEPLNWYASHARLICDALAGCAEADAAQQGRYIFLTARVPGSAGNSIALSLTGVQAGGSAARAVVTPGEDLDAAGALTDGVNSVELEALGAPASVSVRLEYLDGTMWPEFGISATGRSGYVVETMWEGDLTAETVQDYVDFLNGGEPGSLQGVAVASWEVRQDGEIWLTLEAAGDWAGAAGNALLLEAFAPSPFSGNHSFQGGVDGGRTLGDLADAINGEDDFPFTAATEGTAASGSAVFNRAFTSARVTVSRGGTRLAQVTLSGFSSGVGGLATAINGNSTLAGLVHATSEGSTLTLAAAQSGAAANGTEVEVLAFSLPSLTRTITLAGGSGGSGIVLTANEAGSDGNGIGVRASGCFGVAGQFSGGTDASGYDYSLTPFSGGGGQDIRLEYDGLLGQRAREDLPQGWKVVSHSVNFDKGKQPPPCVVGVTSIGNMQAVSFVVPAGANPYQRGALVLEVSYDRTAPRQVEREDWEYDPERAKELARREVRGEARRQNKTREDALPWMLVKGSPIPTGWAIASGAANMRLLIGVKEVPKWQRFWAQFGEFRILARITSGLAFGRPYFFPVAAEDAYPPDEAPAFVEDTGKMGKPLAPPISETSNVPANYKILGPGDNMHLHVEGSFPASSKAGGNVGGLKFCKGALMQYAVVNEKLEGVTNEEALDFFKGSCETNGHVRRFVCLKVEGTFINRARKRYQEGTNRHAPSDPDYDEDKDGGAGWHIVGDRTEDDPEPEQGLTKTDYMEAARAYLAACSNAGVAGRTEEVTAYVVGGEFDADLTVDDVFAALGMEPAASGGYHYNSRTREVSARASSGQSENLQIDDFLTRRKAAKEAQWLDWKERHKDGAEAMDKRRERESAEDPTPYPLTPQEQQQEKEKESFPMVSPSIHASAGVSCESKPLNPFEVYADGSTWYVNEGELGTPGGPIYCEKKEIPPGLWKKGRRFYVKAVYDRSAGKWVARYKYHDKEQQQEDQGGNG